MILHRRLRVFCVSCFGVIVLACVSLCSAQARALFGAVLGDHAEGTKQYWC